MEDKTKKMMSEQWQVQELADDGTYRGLMIAHWMIAHTCQLKGEKGYYEAKAWIEKQKKGETK